MAEREIEAPILHPFGKQSVLLDDKPAIAKIPVKIEKAKKLDEQTKPQSVEVEKAKIINRELKIDDALFKRYIEPAYVPSDEMATMNNLYALLRVGGVLNIEYEAHVKHKGGKLKSPNDILGEDERRADCGEISMLFIATARQLNLDISGIRQITLHFELEKDGANSVDDFHAAIATIGENVYLLDFTFRSSPKLLSSLDRNGIAKEYEGTKEFDPIAVRKDTADGSAKKEIPERMITKVHEPEIATVEQAVAGRLNEKCQYCCARNAFQTALGYISDAYALDKGTPVIKENLIIVYTNLGDELCDLADRELKKPLPDAKLCEELLSNAASYYSKAAELSPADARLLDNIGYALEKQGKKQDALAEYRKAIGLDKHDTIAYLNCCMISLELGQIAHAESYLNVLSQLNPGDSGLINLRQRLLIDKADATADLGMNAYLSREYKQAKDYFANAIEYMKKALDYPPNPEITPSLERNLSIYEANLEKIEKTIEHHQ